MKNKMSFILSCLSLLLVCFVFWLFSFRIDYSTPQIVGAVIICIVWGLCVFIYNSYNEP